MVENLTDQRKSTRVFPHIEVELTHPEMGIIPCQTRDISMKGIAIDGCRSFPIGAECGIIFHLGGKDAGNRIELRGRVARSDSNGMALEFTEILGMESFEHLRNLIFYNAGPDDDIENEVRDSLGLKMSGRHQGASK
ncbi:MAG: PilZ domain-containing protein [Candidatus Riflebacteria bacterium]|nr:PilZ domain-containing protein [Candidatus Riflebacteria bacterium]